MHCLGVMKLLMVDAWGAALRTGSLFHFPSEMADWRAEWAEVTMGLPSVIRHSRFDFRAAVRSSSVA